MFLMVFIMVVLVFTIVVIGTGADLNNLPKEI
jgi:hypothetical protein